MLAMVWWCPVPRPAGLVVKWWGLSEAEAADDLGRCDDLACVALGVFSDVEKKAYDVRRQGLSPNGP